MGTEWNEEEMAGLDTAHWYGSLNYGEYDKVKVPAKELFHTVFQRPYFDVGNWRDDRLIEMVEQAYEAGQEGLPYSPYDNDGVDEE